MQTTHNPQIPHPRFLQLMEYDCQSSNLTFEVHDATPLIYGFRYLRESGVRFFIECLSNKDIVTIQSLNKIGPAYIELFLAQLKKKAVESYGQDQWMKFVTELRERAKVDTRAHLPGTTIFKSSLFSSRVTPCLSTINNFLDVRSLASFQTVAFGATPKSQHDEKKRDFTSIRFHFSPVWKKRAEEHYPSGPTLKYSLSQSVAKPQGELDYNARYYASASNARERLILHSTITGDAARPVMTSITYRELHESKFIRGMRNPRLTRIAKQYNHSHLLQIWWERLIAPFFKIDDHTFDLTKKDARNFTVLDKAIHLYQSDMIPKLLEVGANFSMNTLRSAILAEDIDSARRCLEKSLPINALINDSETALLAAGGRNLQLTSMLLEKKADPNLRVRDNNDTSLILSAWRANSACVLKLLEAKADCKAINNDQETALHWAVENTDLVSLDALLKQQTEEKLGVASNPLLVATKVGQCTPFHLSLVQQKEQVAQRLLQTAALNINVLRQMLLHTNEKKQSTLALAAAFPTLSLLNNILTVAARHSISFPDTEIATILDLVKNDLAILKLLEKMVTDAPLKERIIKLRENALTAFRESAMQSLMESAHTDSSLFGDDPQKAPTPLPGMGR